MLSVDHSNTDGPPLAVKYVRKLGSAFGGEVTFVCVCVCAHACKIYHVGTHVRFYCRHILPLMQELQCRKRNIGTHSL